MHPAVNTTAAPALPRHYGLDWLRVGAFALLIFYHIVMAYGPEHWVIHSYYRYSWLRFPLEMVSPWRLMVLFVVSGYATAAMMSAAKRRLHFLQSRSSRLLIPLLFGVAVIVPVQGWVVQSSLHGYQLGYFHFWANDYFRFGTLAGEGLPHWEHLWFLAYLWLYTMLLAGWLALGGRLSLPAFFGRERAILLWPITAFFIGRMTVIILGIPAVGLFDNWVGHIHYLPSFILGYVLARDPRLWAIILRERWAALTIAVLGYGITIIAEPFTFDAGFAHKLAMVAYDFGDTGFAWAMTIFLIAAADAWFNHDHRWRLPLSRAVFPAYIVHQSAIVLIIYVVRDRALGVGIEATLVLAGTIATCLCSWWLAKSWGPAGLVLGYVVPTPRTYPATGPMLPT